MSVLGSALLVTLSVDGVRRFSRDSTPSLTRPAAGFLFWDDEENASIPLRLLPRRDDNQQDTAE